MNLTCDKLFSDFLKSSPSILYMHEYVFKFFSILDKIRSE